MKKTNNNIKIRNRDYWFKKVELFQQNWALTEKVSDNSCNVYFIEDNSFVIDEMTFASSIEAISSLQRNGFHRYYEDGRDQQLIVPPKPPFQRKSHSQGSICSSGWYCC